MAAGVAVSPLLLFGDVASIRDLIRSGRLAEAVEQCNRELGAAPRNAALLTLKGLALQAAGDAAGGLTALRLALTIDPRSMAALQAAAQLEFSARDPQAQERLRTILHLAPETQPARAMLATLLYEARNCPEALPLLAQLPAEPAVRWQYGVCLFEQRQWREAASQFAALLKLREHEPTRFNLALAHYEARDYRAAMAALQPLSGVDARRLLAAAHQAVGETPRAIAALQTALEQHPGDERLLIDLAVLCIDHQAWPLGVEVLEAGLRRWPRSARLHTLLGVVYVRAGEMEKAQAAFRTAEEPSPAGNPGLGRIGLASALMQMGLAEDAVKLLRPLAAGAEGGDPRVSLTLARALVQGSDTNPAHREEAAQLLSAAVKADPANAAAHSLLGKLLAQDRKWGPAEKSLREAVRLDGSDRAAHYQLMVLYRRTGRPALAAGAARRVQELVADERAAEPRQFQLLRAN